jgi:hypothetical protein
VPCSLATKRAYVNSHILAIIRFSTFGEVPYKMALLIANRKPTAKGPNQASTDGGELCETCSYCRR